jgi:hypothetical protein
LLEPPSTSAAAPRRGALRVAALVFFGTLAYAVVRYHGFKGVPWSQLALYTVNKAWAVTAVILAGLALLAGSAGRRPEARALGVLAALTGVAHGAASALVLRPAYFPKMFEPDGRLHGSGEVSMALGVLSLVVFLHLLVVQAPGGSDSANGSAGRRPLAAAALLLAAGHSAFQGVEVWLEPASWPGGMPPLTFIGCIAALGAAALALRRR